MYIYIDMCVCMYVYAVSCIASRTYQRIRARHNLYDHSTYGSRVLKKNEKTLESTEEKEAEMSCCSLVLVLILWPPPIESEVARIAHIIIAPETIFSFLLTRWFWADSAREWQGVVLMTSIRLPGKGNSNSHGEGPVHKIISMIKWIQTSPSRTLSLVLGTLEADIIRASIYDKCGGSTKITTHLDHISHYKTTSSKNRLKRWTYRVCIINTRRDEIRTSSGRCPSSRIPCNPPQLCLHIMSVFFWMQTLYQYELQM